MESQDEDLVKRSELTAESTKGRSDTTTFYIDNAKHVAALEKLLSDPLLADLPARPTLQDVETHIALEKGSAMKLKIIQMDRVSYNEESFKLFGHDTVSKRWCLA